MLHGKVTRSSKDCVIQELLLPSIRVKGIGGMEVVFRLFFEIKLELIRQSEDPQSINTLKGFKMSGEVRIVTKELEEELLRWKKTVLMELVQSLSCTGSLGMRTNFLDLDCCPDLRT